MQSRLFFSCLAVLFLMLVPPAFAVENGEGNFSRNVIAINPVTLQADGGLRIELIRPGATWPADAGSLAHGVKLPLDTDSYKQLALARGRFFGVMGLFRHGASRLPVAVGLR